LNESLARIFRAESGQVLSSLMYVCQDLQMAEDALQDAFVQASIQWPKEGSPENKGAWLHTVAKRKLIDKLRQSKSQKSQQKLQLIEQNFSIQSQQVAESDYDVPDERLRLIFTCCHPALNAEAQVALTLRTLCGINVKEIARAYLTSEVAMGQRITRAKKKIKDAGIAYSVPTKDQLVNRLPSVLKVIYLIYNESYNAYESQTLTKAELAQEAIRLSLLMVELLPNSEVLGLAALLLFHDSRRGSRQSAQESYIPLEKQNRKLWDDAIIQRADHYLCAALDYQQPGPYLIQAAISSLHANAQNWHATDWRQIHLLYSSLYRLNPSAIVALNCAVSLAFYGDINKAYKNIIELEDTLKRYQPYYAAKAELEVRLKQYALAMNSLNEAIKLSKNNSERDFLLRRLNTLKHTL